MEKEVSSQPAAINYELAFYSKLQELGIQQIYEPGSETGKHNAAFINLMSDSRNSLKDEIRLKRAVNRLNLEELVSSTDRFIIWAREQGWLSPEVESAWRVYKRGYILNFVEEEILKREKKPTALKSIGLTILQASLYAALIGAAVAGGTYAVYEYFIKPDIKREIIKVREEVMNNQSGLSSEDINRICDTVEERYPFFKGMKKPAEPKEKK